MSLPFRVDLTALESVVDDLERFIGTLDTHLSQLDAASADLHVTWQREAAAGHTEAHRRLMQGAAKAREGVAAMHQAARRAHTNYSAAAEANVKTWAQLR